MPLFNIAELVQIGIEDETSGVMFYSALEKKTKNATLRKVYHGLAEQERLHKKRFEEMLAGMGEVGPTETYEGEYIAYLRAMLESRAFPNAAAAERIAAELRDDASAIALAIRFERDTLVLLNELRNMVPERDRGTVDDLVREEQGHLVELTRALGLCGS